MSRSPKQPIRHYATPVPQGAELPRYACRRQLAEIYHRLYGPMSHRTLETWPLSWRTVNGRAVASVQEFMTEAEQRFNAAPVIRGGRNFQKAA